MIAWVRRLSLSIYYIDTVQSVKKNWLVYFNTYLLERCVLKFQYLDWRQFEVELLVSSFVLQLSSSKSLGLRDLLRDVSFSYRKFE
jgi:hypothetical protein